MALPPTLKWCLTPNLCVKDTIPNWSGPCKLSWMNSRRIRPPLTQSPRIRIITTRCRCRFGRGTISERQDIASGIESSRRSDSEIIEVDWSSDWSYAKVMDVKTMQKRISATEFKAKCLKILDVIEPEGIVITKRGHPVARLLPVHTVDNSKLIGSMKGKITIKGNILSTGRRWNAQS